MSDVESIQKREEDERLDTAEDPNEEVRYQRSSLPLYKEACRNHRDLRADRDRVIVSRYVKYSPRA